MRTKKILIVGGSGYLGSALLKKLSRDFDVYAPRREILELGSKSTYGYLDRLEFDFVLILAATIDGLSLGDTKTEVINNNVGHLNEFLDYIKNRKCKLVYFSSMAVYGDSVGKTDELSMLNAVNIYGLSKIMAENLIEYYSRFAEFDSVVLRIPGVYGGNRKAGLLYKVRQNALSGAEIALDLNGLTNWETINISDVCSVVYDILQAYEFSTKVGVLNVGYGVEVDLVKLVYRIVSDLGSDSKVTIKNCSYKPFYMSTDRLKKYVVTPISFDNSLKEYLTVEKCNT